MLERRHRLTSTAGFTATTRGGRRAGSRTLVLHLNQRMPSSEPGSPAAPRVGFVVGRAVGNAVTRNRVKRRLRHLVHARLPLLPARADVVVRALPAAAAASYPSLGRDLDQALGRLGVTNGDTADPAEQRSPAS